MYLSLHTRLGRFCAVAKFAIKLPHLFKQNECLASLEYNYPACARSQTNGDIAGIDEHSPCVIGIPIKTALSLQQ